MSYKDRHSTDEGFESTISSHIGDTKGSVLYNVEETPENRSSWS